MRALLRPTIHRAIALPVRVLLDRARSSRVLALCVGVRTLPRRDVTDWQPERIAARAATKFVLPALAVVLLVNVVTFYLDGN